MRGYKDDDPDTGVEGTDHNVLCLNCGHEGPPKVTRTGGNSRGKESCQTCGSDNLEEVES